MSEDANRTDAPPADRVTTLWRRVKDHRIAQWMVGYVAVAYGIQHAINLTSDAFEWPHAVTRISMLLLILGVPLAMVFAWYHGERTTRRISAGEMTTASLLLVLIALVFYAVVRPSEQHVSAPVAQEANLTAARAAAASPRGAISVAVLPFLDLSPAKDQEFFSDGMTEEITAALAKVPDLRVVARTSAFQFKGKNADVQNIGRLLHATHVIEGSIRKAGNRLRITAQLINADDGTHLWAEDYDRELTDVFAIQEDIARAITSSLHMTLGLKPGENLVNQRTKDVNLHDEYLRAKILVRENVPEAIGLLSDVVARDPNYAPAWGVLARAYTLARITNSAAQRLAVDEGTPLIRDYGAKAAVAAETAYRLDPTNSDAVYAYSEIEQLRGRANSVASLALLERALALDPDNPEPLQTYSLRLAALGFTNQALRVHEHLLQIEPFVPQYQAAAARLLLADGQLDAAIKLANGPAGEGGGLFEKAQAYAARGRFVEAADALANLNLPDKPRQDLLVAAVRILRGAPATVPQNDRPELGMLDWIYVYRGAPERLAAAYETLLRAGLPNGPLSGSQFTPAYVAMRKTSLFKQYIRDSGALEYWRAKGWPPQCHPTTGDDFECS